MFEDYIRDHVVSWFNWAQNNKLVIDMEDLILVSSCSLATSWAAAAFMGNNMEAEISLASIPLGNGGASIIWSKSRGPVESRNSRLDQVRSPGYVYLACADLFSLLYGKQPTTQDQCVFIKGFRAKRSFFFGRRIRAAAEPQPDDPDNHRDDEIQVTQAPGVPKVSFLFIVGRWIMTWFQYRDPLSEVLDYIVEVRPSGHEPFLFDVFSGPQKKCRLDDTVAEETIAIAHDDDLQLIGDVVRPSQNARIDIPSQPAITHALRDP